MMGSFLRRVRALWHRRREAADLHDEIETHRSLRQAQLERDGMSRAAAALASRRAMGNTTLMHEDARQVWIVTWFDSLRQDLRYAVRSCARQPLFSLTAVLVLALGIGLVTMLASFAHATFLRPWKVPNPDEFVLMRASAAPGSTDMPRGVSIPEFRYLQSRARTFSQVVMTFRGGGELFDETRSLGRVRTLQASASYIDALQARIVVGRGFAPDEDDFRAPRPVAVISDSLWRNRFGRDPGVVGRSLRLGRQTFVVIGVAAVPGFLEVAGSGYDVVFPMATRALEGADGAAPFTDPRNASPVSMLAGRLQRGVTQAAAAQELTRLSGEFRREAGIGLATIHVRDTRPSLGGDEWQVTQIVMLALVLVQLLACANVGNMLLARGLARQREIATRLSIGANRARVVSQLVTEAAVLSCCAGAVGLSLPLALPSIIRAIGSEAFQQADFYAMEAPIFWLAFAMAALTTVICGVAPALRATRLDLASVAAERHGQTSHGLRLRRTLLAVQIALAAVLLTAAGLLTRAIDHALSVDPGFALSELQTIEIALPNGTPIARRLQFHTLLAESLAQSDLPPVAMALDAPLTDSRYSLLVRESQGRPSVVRLHGVSPNYFEVLGIRLLAGRAATGHTIIHSPNSWGIDGREIVVSESLARRLWPGQNAVGKALQSGARADDIKTHEVVGVVADVAMNTLSEREPIVYQAASMVRGTLFVRDLSPSIVNRVLTIARTIEPAATISSRPLTDNARESLQIGVIASRVAWGISALALLLATIGAFGVFSYIVEERRREIGIRIALGARGSQVVGFVLGSTQRTVLMGLVLGLGLTAGAVPLLREYLYGLSPFDPIAYLLVAAILGASVALATWIPARRATRVDPAVTLRS